HLVIEQVSVRFKVPVGQMAEVELTSSTKVPVPPAGNWIGTQGSHFFTPVNKVNGAKDWYSMTEQTKIYAAPGTSILWRLNRSDSSGSVDLVQMTITGY